MLPQEGKGGRRGEKLPSPLRLQDRASWNPTEARVLDHADLGWDGRRLFIFFCFYYFVKVGNNVC